MLPWLRTIYAVAAACLLMACRTAAVGDAALLDGQRTNEEAISVELRPAARLGSWSVVNRGRLLPPQDAMDVRIERSTLAGQWQIVAGRLMCTRGMSATKPGGSFEVWPMSGQEARQSLPPGRYRVSVRLTTATSSFARTAPAHTYWVARHEYDIRWLEMLPQRRLLELWTNPEAPLCPAAYELVEVLASATSSATLAAALRHVHEKQLPAATWAQRKEIARTLRRHLRVPPPDPMALGRDPLRPLPITPTSFCEAIDIELARLRREHSALPRRVLRGSTTIVRDSLR